MKIRKTAPAPPENLASFADQLNLTITYVRADSIVPLGRKTRTHEKAQIQGLANAIKEFGFIKPIVIDHHGRNLAGSGCLEAARLLGMTHVPVVIVSHLTSAQSRLFAIADNRLAELAGWDPEALAIELDELRNLDVTLNVEITGFSDAQIDGLLATVGNSDDRADSFTFASVPVVSQVGDLWILGVHRLVCGDATDSNVVDRVMEGDRARVIITDPPYNLKIHGQVIRSAGHGEFVMGSGEMTDDAFAAFLSKIWAIVEQVLLSGGLAYIYMDWRHQRHILKAMDGKALELLNLIVWNKAVPGMGGFYRSQHELVFLAKKGGGEHLNRIKFGESGLNRSNVWTYPGVQGFGKAKAKLRELHPTVKPAAMIRDALLDSSERGDVVLDLFSGSGTTLIAAETSKRKGRAVELDPLYVDTGVVRWQDYTGTEAILAETGGTFSQVRARRAAAAVQTLTNLESDPGRPHDRPSSTAAVSP